MYEVFFRHRNDSPSQVICDDGSLEYLIYLLETHDDVTEYMVWQGGAVHTKIRTMLTKKIVTAFDYQKEW